MSTTPSSSAPAGWYPDPQGGPYLRWWDGTAWTEHVSQPPQPSYRAQPSYGVQQAYGEQQPHRSAAADLRAPAGTKWNTPWIWLLLLLPLLPIIPLLFLDWGRLVRVDPVTLEPNRYASLALLSSPAYVTSVLGGLLVYALVIVSAYLDWRELGRRGVPEPFHWAWTFLSAYVYGIGRAVVTRRRGAGGEVVMWVAIGVVVLSVLLGVGITLSVTAAVLSQLPLR